MSETISLVGLTIKMSSIVLCREHRRVEEVTVISLSSGRMVSVSGLNRPGIDGETKVEDGRGRGTQRITRSLHGS